MSAPPSRLAVHMIPCEKARSVSLPPDREILHLLPQEFILDDQPGVRDPAGMMGCRLEVNLHLVTGSSSAIQNVITVSNRAGVHVDNTVYEARTGITYAGTAEFLLSIGSDIAVEAKEIEDIVVHGNGGSDTLTVSGRVRHQRCAAAWLAFSTTPLRLPCRGGHTSTATV